jgi:ABC-type nitrate/sulfonate/bicarbonate transport system permease component
MSSSESKSSDFDETAVPLSPGEFLLSYPNLVRTLSASVFLVVWEIFGRHSNPIFMTYPTAILRAGTEIVVSGELAKAFLASAIPFSIAMIISIIFGIAIGLAMGLFPLAEYVLDPYVNALNAVPRIALVPLVILWCGLGLPAKVVIIISIAIFPIIINTFAGVRAVQKMLLDIGRAYSATNWQILRKIIMPAAMPFVMTGIRLGIALGIIGMIVAEFFTAIGGLGGIIVEYGNTFQTAKMFVAIATVGLMGVVLTEAVMILERRWTSWRVSESQQN